MIAYVLATLLLPLDVFRLPGSDHYGRAGVAGGVIRAGIALVLARQVSGLGERFLGDEISRQLLAVAMICVAVALWLMLTAWTSAAAWGTALMLRVSPERILGVVWRSELTQLPALLVIGIWSLFAPPPLPAVALLLLPGLVWSWALRVIGITARLQADELTADVTVFETVIAVLGGWLIVLVGIAALGVGSIALIMRAPEVIAVLETLGLQP